MSENDNKRTFIGFSISINNQQRLIDIQQRLASHINSSATPVRNTNLHITAAFLGLTSAQDIEKIDTELSSMSLNRFSQRLEHISYWPKAKILCIEGIASIELRSIVEQLTQLTKQLNLHQSQHDYRPHISLFRHVKTPSSTQALMNEITTKASNMIKLAPISFDITELTLFESKSTPMGVEYLALKSWPLN
ncbi:RNA 2',3'-cyclic phosphodiesterase [Shewanella sp. 10N.7]|uniref:RNA 2',3'-cyclic phosphodiesterase n=1 Tax=Shewanella sp. 10N.7 TaxID=2885093 RepID=UPI001E3E671B|nr:RNA 2',3'-cyclic phosphodiesterase [Shewanella sp. 10N.7]MCC4834158.1 RNA 2',3'-cyclic phosphodiesterase [Shewanella sp. 10N.7]